MAAPARAVDPQAVNRAIDRGVAALRSMQAANGSWPHEAGRGATALVGLTLLECGAGPDDKAVAAAARHARQECIRCNYVYALSTAILFLDRLGDTADVPLIESMAVRLFAGQPRDGGWRYTTPAISADEMRRLEARARDRPSGARDRQPGDGQRTPRTVSPEIQGQLELLAPAGPPGSPPSRTTQTPSSLPLPCGRRGGTGCSPAKPWKGSKPASGPPRIPAAGGAMLTGFRFVNLTETRMTDRGVAELQQALPDLQVLFHLPKD